MVKVKKYLVSYLIIVVGDIAFYFFFSLYVFIMTYFLLPSSFVLLSRTSYCPCVIDSHANYYCVYIFSIYIHVVFSLLSLVILLLLFSFSPLCFLFVVRLNKDIELTSTHIRTSTIVYRVFDNSDNIY